jgi:hypothetical protein
VFVGQEFLGRRLEMRQIWAVVMVSLAISVAGATQEDAPKPKVSKDPLTAEQIAVYRTVLRDYTKGSGGSLNLADKTEPLDQSGPFFDKSCMKGLELEPAESSVPVVHQLDFAVASNKKFVLVDPERQEEKIKANDTQNLMKRAIDDGEKVSDKQIENSVKQAFATGLFTLTEIMFDKQHLHAVVAYSFVCGMLCGHGNTLILKKVGQEWKVSKRCGGWVS